VTVPVDLGRDEARELAEEELRSPVYDAAEPTPLERFARWIGDRLSDLLDGVVGLGPGGYGGLLLLVGVVVVAVVVVRLVVGRVGRDARGPGGAVLGATVRSAAEHRRAADEHARRGEWAAAVQERMRAVVRGLEERDLIAPAAGRTAPEVAAEAGRLLPERAAELRTAAAAFDAVVFGGRPAGPDDDARLRALDEALGRTRPQLVP
jgi:hypothetical protein